MKKLFASLAAAMMLVGCAGNTKPAESAAPTEEAAATALKFGVGSFTTVSADAATAEEEGEVTITTTYAGVAVDADNTIKYIWLDAAQNKGAFNAEGVITTDPETGTKTKKEKLDEYGMRGVSEKTGIGKEWFEQAEGFEAWAMGKKLDEVVNMETVVNETGHTVTTDADLLSTTTIGVDGFIGALKAASESLVDVEGAAQFGTGSSTAMSRDNASADGEGRVQASVTYGIFAVDADGKVVKAITDCAQNTVKFDMTGAIVGDVAAIPTKAALKEEYGMKATSEKIGVGKEWYEQNEGFDTWCEGKMLAEIYDMPTEEGAEENHPRSADADLKTTTTITITGFTAATKSASDNLKAVAE